MGELLLVQVGCIVAPCIVLFAIISEIVKKHSNYERPYKSEIFYQIIFFLTVLLTTSSTTYFHTFNTGILYYTIPLGIILICLSYYHYTTAKIKK